MTAAFQDHIAQLVSSVDEGDYANATADKIDDNTIGVELPEGERFLIIIESVDA